MSNTKQLLQQLDTMVSEGRNPNTMRLDTLSNHELLACINSEDQKVAGAVRDAIPSIAEALESQAN